MGVAVIRERVSLWFLPSSPRTSLALIPLLSEPFTPYTFLLYNARHNPLSSGADIRSWIPVSTHPNRQYSGPSFGSTIAQAQCPETSMIADIVCLRPYFASVASLGTHWPGYDDTFCGLVGSSLTDRLLAVRGVQWTPGLGSSSLACLA